MTNKKNIYAHSLLHTCSTSAILLMLACCMACSGSDPMEPTPTEKQTAISFSGTMPEEQAVTRAGLEEVLTGDKTFQVWGYKNDAYDDATTSYTSYQAVMPNFTVNWGANTAYTTTSNTNDWEYVGQGATEQQRADQTIKYWDFSAKAYRFFGYALGNATADPPTSPAAVTVPGGFPTGNSSSSSADAVTFSAAVDATSEATIAAAPYFSRLWFSNGNAVTYPDRQFGRPVQLQFVKPFARVRFLFTYPDDASFDRKDVKNIRFYPTDNSIIPTAGTVNVSYPLKGSASSAIQEQWSVAATPAPTGINAFVIDYYDAPDPIPSGFPVSAQPKDWPNSPQHWYYVLPTPTQSSYTIEAAVVSDEVKTAVVPAEFMSWLPGYQYTYKFKINSSGGIVIEIIQVAINSWGNGGESTHIVYNW